MDEAEVEMKGRRRWRGWGGVWERKDFELAGRGVERRRLNAPSPLEGRTAVGANCDLRAKNGHHCNALSFTFC